MAAKPEEKYLAYLICAVFCDMRKFLYDNICITKDFICVFFSGFQSPDKVTFI